MSKKSLRYATVDEILDDIIGDGEGLEIIISKPNSNYYSITSSNGKVSVSSNTLKNALINYQIFILRSIQCDSILENGLSYFNLDWNEYLEDYVPFNSGC